MKRQLIKQTRRTRRKFRVRNHLRTNVDRPRLSVHRTAKHIYCQIICDKSSKTLCAASTAEKAISEEVGYGGNKDAAKKVGLAIAKKALAAGIKEVRFDRGFYRFHGRVAELAAGAREGGLEL